MNTVYCIYVWTSNCVWQIVPFHLKRNPWQISPVFLKHVPSLLVQKNSIQTINMLLFHLSEKSVSWCTITSELYVIFSFLYSLSNKLHKNLSWKIIIHSNYLWCSGVKRIAHLQIPKQFINLIYCNVLPSMMPVLYSVI